MKFDTAILISWKAQQGEISVPNDFLIEHGKAPWGPRIKSDRTAYPTQVIRYLPIKTSPIVIVLDRPFSAYDHHNVYSALGCRTKFRAQSLNQLKANKGAQITICPPLPRAAPAGCKRACLRTLPPPAPRGDRGGILRTLYTLPADATAPLA